MTLVKDTFTKIEEYPSYEINVFGSVRHEKTKSPIANQMSDGGRLYVQLWQNGKRKNEFVHRLVAKTFLPNPKKLQDVNHIDENPCNNYVGNLEWMSRKDNCNYGTRNRRIGEGRARKVITNKGEIFDSIIAAGKFMNLSEAAIRNSINKNIFITNRINEGGKRKRGEIIRQFAYLDDEQYFIHE